MWAGFWIKVVCSKKKEELLSHMWDTMFQDTLWQLLRLGLLRGKLGAAFISSSWGTPGRFRQLSECRDHVKLLRCCSRETIKTGKSGEVRLLASVLAVSRRAAQS